MFSYRYYYSEQQKRTIAYLGNDGENFIVLSTGMKVEYTECCSFPNSKCNWEDARLVYASDVEPQIEHNWGPQEKEEWDRLCQEALNNNEGLCDWDTPLDDEPYEPEIFNCMADKSVEQYVRGEDFGQDT